MILGILGALIGSWLYTAISGNEDTSGIDWIALIIGVIVAALLSPLRAGHRRPHHA